MVGGNWEGWGRTMGTWTQDRWVRANSKSSRHDREQSYEASSAGAETSFQTETIPTVAQDEE